MLVLGGSRQGRVEMPDSFNPNPAEPFSLGIPAYSVGPMARGGGLKRQGRPGLAGSRPREGRQPSIGQGRPRVGLKAVQNNSSRSRADFKLRGCATVVRVVGFIDSVEIVCARKHEIAPKRCPNWNRQLHATG